MKAYKTKTNKYPGSEFHEVNKKAHRYYRKLKSKSRRRAYVRSAYFKKDKIFIDYFWSHAFEKKNWRDRMRRLKYLACAIELVRNSRFEPTSKENPNNRSEILHRFAGITAENDLFYVQIKEDKRSGQKFLISVFPHGNK